jgi:hypothetical protein
MALLLFRALTLALLNKQCTAVLEYTFRKVVNS